MDSHDPIVWVVIGLVAGALAGRIVEGGGFGCIGNIVVGLAGAVVGGVLLHELAPDVRYHTFGTVIVSFIGAVLLLSVLRLVSGGRHLGGARRRRR